MSFVIPLLFIAAGFDAIMNGRIWGVVWLVAAGVMSKIGTGFLRFAEGMKFNSARSGETRNRALELAKEMGVRLRSVYIVPAGKGHLTNAFGLSNAVGVTDNLGKYLSREQIKFVIAHELAHVKLKHGRKHLLLVIGIYAVFALLIFLTRQGVDATIKPVLVAIVLVVPLILTYLFSRRCEYDADHAAVQFTGDSETAIRALTILHQTAELPVRVDRLSGILMTHPPFSQRIHAIADFGHISPSRLLDILADEGVREPANS